MAFSLSKCVENAYVSRGNSYVVPKNGLFLQNIVLFPNEWLFPWGKCIELQ
jgi:hypothetical protein